MRRVCRRFEHWRKERKGRLPILEALWAAVAEVARDFGVFRTAQVLLLEHGKLRRIVEWNPPIERHNRPRRRRRFGNGAISGSLGASALARNYLTLLAKSDPPPRPVGGCFAAGQERILAAQQMLSGGPAGPGGRSSRRHKKIRGLGAGGRAFKSPRPDQ
jgi:hypothetical protein